MSTGYLIPSNTVSDARDLAETVCDRVRSGDTTFARERIEAVETGAPKWASDQWNSFLENDFCPAYWG